MIDEVLPPALAGERLDRVVSMLDGCSRATAARLVDGGAVTVDGLAVTQRSYRVDVGMRVAFEPPGLTDEPMVPDSDVAFDIVHVDEDIVVVDKPPGLVVHPGAGRLDKTLANGLLARFPDIRGVGQPGRPGIVHRLDADTSGLLVVALSQRAYDPLVEALARHDVARVYAAVVEGTVDDDRGTIDAPIGRAARNRTRMAVMASGREARTHYQVIQRAPAVPASWLRCELETGRTHQIRVHLGAISHPVIGDRLYGKRSGVAPINRIALHAHQLCFDHPISGLPMRFESPLADDIELLLETLGFDPALDGPAR